MGILPFHHSNINKTALLCLLLSFLCISAKAQKKFTLSGYVKDSASGESLSGASVSAPAQQQGAIVNTYGFYSITLPEGDYTFIYRMAGYKKTVTSISLYSNIRADINLAQDISKNVNVEISGSRGNANITNTDMGKVELQMDLVKSLPVLFGEVDILKTLQLLPGIQSAGEGNTGFYVRGGGPDQNLVQLDEAVVYNTGHLFGFFSVFNGDAIRDLNIIKGGMPAEYGGRLASVLDIDMKEGNNKTYTIKGGIGLIASRLTIEGPLNKGKGSFIVSARRTYIDALIQPFVKGTTFQGSGYYFYDLNAKVNYRITYKDRLYLSTYMGKDVFTFHALERDFSIHMPWGNQTATLRWNHLFNDKLFMNLSLIYNDYKFQANAIQNQFEVTLFSGIRDYNAKMDFSYFYSPKHTIKWGALYTYHTFTPSSISGRSGDVSFDPGDVQRKYAHEAALYIQDDWKISRRLGANIGLRYSYFMLMGPYSYLQTDNTGNIISQQTYQKGEAVKPYSGPEPRALFRYLINNSSSIKGGITMNRQYVHLVSNAASTLPTDIWVPSTRNVLPQQGIQYSLGYFKNISNNIFETSAEVYYKRMYNQIEYRQNYIPQISQELEKDFVYGNGESYGAEWLIRKNIGKLCGWLGYTLSWTNRRFPDLNNGNIFPAKYDRRHDISLVLNYKMDDRWSFSGVFVYASGNAYTMPQSYYIVSGVPLINYGDINNYRMPAYHRADISATLNGKAHLRYKSSWTFSVYNLYNRHNPYFIYFRSTGNFYNGDLQIQARKVSLFPTLPSVSWNFSF